MVQFKVVILLKQLVVKQLLVGAQKNIMKNSYHSIGRQTQTRYERIGNIYSTQLTQLGEYKSGYGHSTKRTTWLTII